MNPIAGKTGILQTSAGTYEFTLASCGIFKEGDIDDIEIRGAGKTPKGEKFHFDLTSTGNEMTINLGVDQPFKSSDRQIRAGQYVSQPFRLVVTGRVVTVTELKLVDERQQSIDTNAHLSINCGT